MEKQVKIKTGRSLSQIIDLIVRESSSKAQLYRNAVEEKHRQNQMNEEDVESDNDEKETSKPKSNDTEKEKLKTGNVSLEDVVDKLNSIRGGRSFKDENVSKKLNDYFEHLSKAEKIALFAFLKGLAQIVTGEVESSEILDPSNPPADVEMEKSDSNKSVKIKPVIIKKPKKPEEKEKNDKKSSKEDTSGPVPITPKK